MSGPAVSVLIPVFDGAGSLGAALDSALGQTLGDLEVVVIDDASRDGTAALVEARMAGEPRLRLLRQPENRGPGPARSRGLAEARGRWVALLDADDTMAPDRLAALLAEAEADGLDAIADNLALVDPGTGQTTRRAFPLAPEDRIALDAGRFLENTRPGARITLGWMQPLLRRAFLLERGIDWPEIRHGEDLVFAVRLLAAGARMRLLGRAGYRYTERRGSVSGAPSPASRTRRSAEEQTRAVRLLLAETGPALPPRARRRLARMPAEIAAVTRILEARDALDARSPLAAVRAAAAALGHPLGLARALLARFGPGARRLR